MNSMCKDKCTGWVYNWPQDEKYVTYDCCGKEEVIHPRHYLIDFGKYKGQTLDEINDDWYLNFLREKAEKENDWWLSKCLSLKT